MDPISSWGLPRYRYLCSSIDLLLEPRRVRSQMGYNLWYRKQPVSDHPRRSNSRLSSLRARLLLLQVRQMGRRRLWWKIWRHLWGPSQRYARKPFLPICVHLTTHDPCRGDKAYGPESDLTDHVHDPLILPSDRLPGLLRAFRREVDPLARHL